MRTIGISQNLSAQLASARTLPPLPRDGCEFELPLLVRRAFSLTSGSFSRARRAADKFNVSMEKPVAPIRWPSAPAKMRRTTCCVCADCHFLLRTDCAAFAQCWPRLITRASAGSGATSAQTAAQDKNREREREEARLPLQTVGVREFLRDTCAMEQVSCPQ